MKKYRSILSILVILTLTLTGFSQSASKPPVKESPIKWYKFEEAYNLSKKKPKKIFVDMYTDWCGWCKKMDAETFANPVIAEYMSKNFYCVKFDAERKDTVVIDGQTFVNPNPTGKRTSHQLAVSLLRGKMSYPSFVFLNEQGKLINVVPGYQQAAPFEKLLNWYGTDSYLKMSLEDFKLSYEGKIK